MLRFALVLIALSLSATFLLVHTRVVEADTLSSFLLVANKADHTLGLIDPQAGRQIATVDEAGVTGHEVIASPDGRTAFVPIYGDSGVGLPGSDGNNLVVVDLASRKVTGRIEFGRGVRPHC